MSNTPRTDAIVARGYGGLNDMRKFAASLEQDIEQLAYALIAAKWYVEQSTNEPELGKRDKDLALIRTALNDAMNHAKVDLAVHQ